MTRCEDFEVELFQVFYTHLTTHSFGESIEIERTVIIIFLLTELVVGCSNLHNKSSTSHPLARSKIKSPPLIEDMMYDMAHSYDNKSNFEPEVIDDLLAKGVENISINSEGLNLETSEKYIAQELNQLSITQRDAILHDLHGISDVIDEKPFFVDERLKMLQDELQNISYKPAYDLAVQQNPVFPTERSFKLQFLRADGFNPDVAARRMTAYFEQKLKLFGEQNLTQNIRVLDLDDETIDCLNSGYMQLLPSRDRAGRAVWVAVGKLRWGKSELALVSLSASPIRRRTLSNLLAYLPLFAYHGTLQETRLLVYHDCCFRGRRYTKARHRHALVPCWRWRLSFCESGRSFQNRDRFVCITFESGWSPRLCG